jgi:hypothetical protein
MCIRDDPGLTDSSFMELWIFSCPIDGEFDAMRRVAFQPRIMRHGIRRRIRAQHPTRMRVCIRFQIELQHAGYDSDAASIKSESATGKQSISKNETTAAGMPQRKQTSSNPCISGIKHDFQ